MDEKIHRLVRSVWRVLGVAGIIFSVVCTFLGVAPLDVVSVVIGPKLVAELLYFREEVLGMTSEQARWILVVCGDLSLAAGLYYLFSVYFADRMDRLYVRRTVAEKDYKEIRDKLDATRIAT